MTPIIAIVGRPNVGKSTLFNRLTRSRNALVVDLPGVTRDRLCGICRFDGRTFIIVDTGGLGESDTATEPLQRQIARQSLQAAREADAVIWLVDGRAGLTAADEILSRQLRRNCARLFLGVNKTDGLDADISAAEFHALGLHPPYPLSALTGDGVAGLMQDVCAVLPGKKAGTLPPPDALRIAILGRPNVGKSTLVNRILGEERVLTSEAPGTTRDSVSIPYERNGKYYTLIDTAGVRRRARIRETIEKFSVAKTLQAINETDIVVLLVDGQDAVTDQDAHLLGLVVESGKAVIVAVNKCDGLDAARLKRLRSQVDLRLGFIDYASTLYISALRGDGVDALVKAVDRVAGSINTNPSTHELTRLLEQAVERHPPPMIRGRRIKLRYAHPGGRNPLQVIIHGNLADHVPESYRRYLSNFFRKQLSLTGTPVAVEFRQGENPYRRGRAKSGKSKTVKRRGNVKPAGKKS